ncbi:MAG: S8 family peptidase [Actinomycetota bacterium]
MRRSLIPAALSAVLVASFFAPPSGAVERASTAPQAARGPQKVDPRQVRGAFVPGEILVKFRPQVSRGTQRAVHARFGARVLKRFGGGLGVQHVRLAPGMTVSQAVREYAANPLVEYAEPNAYRFPSLDANDLDYSELWGLNNTGQSHFIADPQTETHEGTADADMDVEEAWETEVGDPSTVIAVLDSGVDVFHPDLAGNIWQNPGEAEGPPGDGDGNGYENDVHGWDFAEDDNTLLEPNVAVAGFDHGTHVAGTIAAVRNNTLGVAGVCGGDAGAAPDLPGCSIMVLKFMKPFDIDDDGSPDSMAGATSDLVEAIEYARNEGAHIINGSFGGPFWSNAEREAFRLAGVSDNILSVLAAGNESLDNDMLLGYPFGPEGAPVFSPSYPASYNLSYILSVAASNDEDRHGYFTGCASPAQLNNKSWCAFSSFGRYSVDVSAPGVDIRSTVPGGGYETWNGTSMAAPHVAGVAGLVKSNNSALTALQIKNMILNSAAKTDELGQPLPLNTGIHTQLYPFPGPPKAKAGRFTRTAGRVDAEAALTGDAVNNASKGHDGDIPGAKGMKATAKGSVAWPGDVNDFKKKKLFKGKKYRFDLIVPKGKDYDLYLYRFGAKEIWQLPKILRASFKGPGADESFKFKAGATRVFFIHVSSWFTNGKYTLKVTCLNC